MKRFLIGLLTGQLKMTEAFDDDIAFSLTFYDDQGGLEAKLLNE